MTRTMRALRGARGRASMALLAFVAAIARGRREAAGRALDRARRAGERRVTAEESALMLVLHAGYPAALEALRLLNECWPGAPRAFPEGAPSLWRRRGERLCRRVYGASYPNLLRNVRGLHPTLAVWMVEQGYGRVLSRPRMSARSRELVAVAVLAAQGWERQLVSHLHGAQRLGCDRASIRIAWNTGRRVAGAIERAAAMRAWRAVFDRSAGEP